MGVGGSSRNEAGTYQQWRLPWLQEPAARPRVLLSRALSYTRLAMQRLFLPRDRVQKSALHGSAAVSTAGRRSLARSAVQMLSKGPVLFLYLLRAPSDTKLSDRRTLMCRWLRVLIINLRFGQSACPQYPSFVLGRGSAGGLDHYHTAPNPNDKMSKTDPAGPQRLLRRRRCC